MNFTLDYVKERIANSISVKQQVLADDALMERILALGMVCVDAYRNGHAWNEGMWLESI